MKKYVFITLGVLCVVLGSIGIVTPVLPTTPFILLAAFLFSRSSAQLHKLLLGNRIFGKYLYNYFNNVPIPLKQKLFSIAFLWAGLGATFYFADLKKFVVVILLSVGAAVSFHIATLGKWKRKKQHCRTFANDTKRPKEGNGLPTISQNNNGEPHL